MTKTALLALSLLLTSATSLHAHETGGSHHHDAPAASAGKAALPQVEALVRTVDKSAKKITLKHGDIPNLDMGAMTMVFQVADPAMLDKVKAGDNVRFTVENIKGAYTVMSIEVMKK